MKTVVGLYMREGDAAKAFETLESAGFSPASIRMLRSVYAIWKHLGCTPRKILMKGLALGAVLGIAIYALFGTIVAFGEETFGFGYSTVIGSLLIFVVAGALVGGVLGFFFCLGQQEQESRLYTMGISRGGVLLVVRTADEHAVRAIDVMRQTEAEGVKICWRTSDRQESPGVYDPPNRLSLQ